MAEIAEGFQTQPDLATGLSLAQSQALGAYLAPRLDRLEDGLGAAVCAYVLQGHEDRVLARIPGLRAVPHFHNILSSLLGYGAQPEVRRVFLEAPSWDPSVVRRLGALLAALGRCGGYARRWPGSPNSPDYLRALVHVSITLLQERASHSSSWLLSAPRCLELLTADGGDQAQLVDVVFSTPDRDSYRQGRRRLLTMSGLAQGLAAAPARALHGARALDEKGRCGFAAFLGQGELAACPELAAHLLDTLAHAGAREREAALSALMGWDRELQMAAAARLLASDEPARRIAAARLLRRTATRAAHALLAQHLALEKRGKVREEMRNALWELDVLTDEGQRASADHGPGYVGIDGRWIEIPPIPPLPPEGELPADLDANVREVIDSATAREAIKLVAVLKGDVPATVTPAASWLLTRDLWADTQAQRCRSRLQTLLSQPGIAPQHLARALALDQAVDQAQPQVGSHSPCGSWARLLVERESPSIAARPLLEHALRWGDLRTVLLATAPLGHSTEVVEALLDVDPARWARVLREAPGPLLWPLVAEHLPMIDQVLGVAGALPVEHGYRISALVLVALLPAPPRRYLPVLSDLAITGLASERALARQLLFRAPDVQEWLAVRLARCGPAGRSAIAAWLGERGERSAIACLRAALAAEQIDTVRAHLCAALVVLGDELADLIQEERLLQEARTGLARMRNEVERCVPLSDLPPLSWAHGAAVPREVIRWLIVLADRLQEPRGNAFLDLLVGRLDAPSAERLGQLVLACFVAYDTRRASEAEANAFAAEEADRYADTLRREYPTWSEQSLLEARDRAFAAYKTELLHAYLNSGVPHCGILALTPRLQASTVVSVVDTYLREHGKRVQQGLSLLDALAHHGSPLALQHLIGIAGRCRLRSLRAHAQGLLESIAQQRRWSWDELLDRTIPTAGLGEAGVLTVESDRGAYTVRLDARLQPVLHNPQGRKLGRLPANSAGRQALKELKTQLKQTIAQQTVRLHEAMCVARQWRPAELECLLRHPIAGRLCEWLIFAGLDSQGELRASFRPLGDGTLSDAADGSVDLADYARIRLAHRAVLNAQQVEAWQQHLQDYRIVPLFEQLERPLLSVAEELAWERTVREREGYMLDTVTLRTQALRLGYQRGNGARFTCYEKRFPSAGLTAVIEFTGDFTDRTRQERSVPCALIALRIEDRGSAEHRQGLPLRRVPAVLLSEAWHDLRDIAAAGSGFDPQWRERVRC